MKDHPLYAAGKLRVMMESFYKKITGVDSLRENRAKRDAMRAMGRRRGKRSRQMLIQMQQMMM